METDKSFLIRILIVDGNPNGIRIITQSGWNGYGAIVPRSMLRDAQTNPDILSILSASGVYILRASSPDSALPVIYIGESDNVLSRLLQHSQRPKHEISEWGDSLIFVSSELNKAHIRYIEARMIERATTARQARLINDTKGYELGRLTLEDKAVANRFLDTMVQCLETIGITFLTATPHLEDTTGEYLYEIRRDGIEARGLFDGSAFWVKSGSTASKTTTAGCPPRYKELREQLIREGVLQEQNDHLVFTTDYRFDAPSAAAAVVLGRSANGWKEWTQRGTGKTLDEVNRVGAAGPATQLSDASGVVLSDTTANPEDANL